MADRLEHICSRIRTSTASCGRDPGSVRLVAVTKTHPADAVREAYAAGQTLFGENYVQEAREKIAALSDLPLHWHFIGHLQSNKAKYAVDLFDLIHTVDSLKLARELDKQAAKRGKVQQILVQVNVGYEQTKSGVFAEDCLDLVQSIALLSHLQILGLMTLPPFFDQPERVRPYFRRLRELADGIRAENLPGVRMEELSMGMTGDFTAAIEEGATLVRVGTAIFGERKR
ncbi:MAG: YggS family pyridoxal phosphate-dependent enzyme [Desulfobacteraceae bacterium]|nr:YggS family pyridoxal phosphate-dependent enzyme [Desulfobacteraceae bacterium]